MVVYVQEMSPWPQKFFIVAVATASTSPSLFSGQVQWIHMLALLSNYDREICLIDVGTEGFATISGTLAH